MDIKLTNGKKIITRSKEQYEANVKHFAMRGFKLVSDQVKETKSNNENIVKLKPKKIMEKLKQYIKLAKDNPKVTAGIIIAIVIVITWIK